MTEVETWDLWPCSFTLHKEELVLCTIPKNLHTFNLKQLLDKMHKQRKYWNPAFFLSDGSAVKQKFVLSPSSPISLHFFTL